MNKGTCGCYGGAREKAPSSSDRSVMPIQQGAFGYLSKKVKNELGFDKMETDGLGPCVGLLLVDSKKRFSVGAHVDAITDNGLLDIASITQSHFPRAIIVYSVQAYDKTLEKVRQFAREVADEIIEKQDRTGGCAKMGVDLDGNFYEPMEVHEGLLDDGEDDGFIRPKLKDMNAYFRKKRAKEYDTVDLVPELRDGQVVRGVGRRYHLFGSYENASYCVRIRIDNTPEDLERIISSVGIPEDVKVERDYSNVLEVHKDEYHIENDRETVKNINKVASQLFNIIER